MQTKKPPLIMILTAAATFLFAAAPAMAYTLVSVPAYYNQNIGAYQFTAGENDTGDYSAIDAIVTNVEGHSGSGLGAKLYFYNLAGDTIGTSATIATPNIQNGDHINFTFGSPVSMTAGTDYKVRMKYYYNGNPIDWADYEYNFTFGNEPPPPPAPSMNVTVPTSLAPAALANIGSTLTDPGTLAVIGIAIGVPFAFYFIKRLIGMLPRRK